MDTLECMRVYACVVDAGGFSAAARRLGLSKALASSCIWLETRNATFREER